MISYDTFQEYYIFLDDHLFDIFEQIKSLKCFNLGNNTQYEGIINVTPDKVTIAFVYLNDNGEYTDFTESLDIPSRVLFNEDALYEWIQLEKVNGTFNTREL